MPRAHCKTPDACRAPKKAGRCPCEVTDKWREAMARLHADPVYIAKRAAASGRPRIYPEGLGKLKDKFRKAGIKGDDLRKALGGPA